MRKFKFSACIFTGILTFCLFAFGSQAFCAETIKPTDTGANMSIDNNQILTRLPNGLLVYIIQDKRFPIVCSRLYARAGSATEQASQAGISHVLEHMVFKGTSHRPKGKVAKDVEALGGYLNAATSFDKTWYLTDMPAAHWRIGIDVVKDMAFQATLDPAELEAEKNVVISELQRGEDSPARKLFENLQVAALKDTPYGRPIIGYEDTIRSLTADDLRAYVKRWYQPQNMMLLVAGDLQPDEVLAYVQKTFGDLQNSSDLAVPEPLDILTAATGSEPVQITKGPWKKVYFGVALPVPGIRDLRSIDLDVLSYILSGDGAAILDRKYKYEKQLVDSISVGNMSLARAGMFTITAQLDAEKVEEFWSELTKDLATLGNKTFTSEEIQRAIFNLEDSIDRSKETLNGLVSWKGSIQFDLGGEQAEENIRYSQRNVDQTRLSKAIAEWLNSARARIRVLAPDNAQLPDFMQILQTNWPASAKTVKSAKMNVGANEFIKLENGCNLILIPDKSAPYISMDFIMAGGNAMLKSEQQGLANLTARLLTDGFGDMNKMAVEKWFSDRAASVAASAGIQTFSVSLSGPARFNAEFFKTFQTLLRAPKFSPSELKREIDDVLAAIKQRDDKPLAYMFAKLNPFLFPGGQPYGYDSLGSAETVGKFNVLDCRDFWTKQIAQPWTIAIAGDFDRDEVLEFVKGLPKPHADKFVTVAPFWGKEKDLSLSLPERNQAHLLQVFETVAATDPDCPALMLLQSILAGQSGLLFTQLRDEQGLGYTVTAFNRNMPLAGFMAFYIGTTPDKIEQSKAGFAKIIDQLKTEPLAAEILQSGANSLEGDYVRGRQSLGVRAGEAATNAILDRPQDFQKQLIDKARQITPQQLQEIARKYLVNPYEVTLLP